MPHVRIYCYYRKGIYLRGLAIIKIELKARVKLSMCLLNLVLRHDEVMETHVRAMVQSHRSWPRH
jgi:hypothetical protein